MARAFQSPIPGPRIKRSPRRVTQHGKTRIDDYAWLRSANWREVLRDPSALPGDIRDALTAENAYCEAVTAPLKPLRAALLNEMRGRIKENDASVPLADGPWRYWTEFREGGEFPIFRRIKDGGEAETLFDGDAERGQSAFFGVGAVRHSPDHRFVAYAVDRVGAESFEIGVRDLETGALRDLAIHHASSAGAIWTAASDGFFYIERDAHQRPKRVKLHRLGEGAAADRVIYEEADDAYFLAIGKTQSGAYVVIESHSHVTTEIRIIPAAAPETAPILIAAREEGVDYAIEHRGEHFFILTNKNAIDFKIVTAPVSSPGPERWTDYVPHRPGSFIRFFIVYEQFIVRLEKRGALPHIIVTDANGFSQEIAFDEAAYAVELVKGFAFDTRILRFAYSSPATPVETYDYDMASGERRLLKTQIIPSGHDKTRYKVERIEARAADGALVPVTILRLAATPPDGRAPLLLHGYGAYAHMIPAEFSPSALSLVDRGMIYAIAHVRGGGARGRQWYLDGKLARKANSVTDFIAAAEDLIRRRYTKAGRIVAFGMSAGGLLVGAAVNRRPRLFGGVIAVAPFVDVLNTISDGSLPLTPIEWPEWGNPIASKEEFAWIEAYSPYENIRARTYPPIMATGGVADSRVTYWEPAKWIARLREIAKGGPFVLSMNMGAGHSGALARFERLDELARLNAFALKCAGLDGAKPVGGAP